ncbi:hypothetical protein ABFS82_09G010700 [Erythranthe guttata]|uniref:Uncharacterized protein n=1 Tax=Erythranthe guttata TaxID=4155 RepID=A0A022Q2L5_ERYGU|nr:hypothetical protein MIMGU_mgv1a019937mg [Erythranthe guttata]
MAYAAVVSLKETIERLMLRSRSEILLSDSEMRLIHGDLCYLQSFLESISPSQSRKTVHALETQIKDAVHTFEDLIDSHLSDNLSLSVSEISEQVLEFRQEISSFTTPLKYEEEFDEEDQQQHIDSFAAIAIVGMVNELIQLLGWLEWNSPSLDIISLVGMAGIGKTTLAKQIYDDSFVADVFGARFFIPIGPKYQLKKILLLALHQAGFHTDKIHHKEDKVLADDLCLYLKNKRFLIVLDDVWDTKVWNELKQFLPNDKNGSRIILTTRLVDVALHASSSCGSILRIPFLDDDESWKLLRETIFNTEKYVLDSHLEKIGKKIAKNCEGLPLAIITIGKLLSETEKTVENWTKFAENENSLIIRMDDDTPISRSVSLSYKQLPQHLKAPFLYIGVFPKDYVISISKLIRLWVVEGLVESGDKSFEEVAQEYLEELVSKSVVLVQERSSKSEKMKTCRIHFVFRNLCVNEAHSEKFFHVIRKYIDSFPECINRQRRLCMHNNVVLGFEQVRSWMEESVPCARSLLCYGPKQQYPVVSYFGFRLLKVLDAVSIRFYEFPHQVVELVHLRYLAITYYGEIPSSVSRLSNLEVLIIHWHHRVIKSSNFPVYLPVEIWKLHKLKHLECMGFDLPDPSPANDDSLILEKLLTLSGVGAHSCTERVLIRIPNLIKLGIRIDSSLDEKFNFLGEFASCYDEFDSFKCIVVDDPGIRSRFVSSPVLNFPANIRKISLSGCGFQWRSMGVIGELPNLEVLKLRWCAFSGAEWEIAGGEGELFPRLKFLLMEDLDVEVWETNSGGGFRRLSRLVIRHCYKLKEIPRGIADSAALEVIEVDDCSSSLANSARGIYMAKHDWVNDHVKIRVRSSWEDNKIKS